jgi:hypothetical protein
MSRRKCPEQQDDRGYLANENRPNTPYHEKLSQTASQSADPCRFSCPRANQRIGEANQGRDPRSPRQRNAPQKPLFVEFVHKQLFSAFVLRDPCDHNFLHQRRRQRRVQRKVQRAFRDAKLFEFLLK